jgi:hypothetical protein
MHHGDGSLKSSRLDGKSLVAAVFREYRFADQVIGALLGQPYASTGRLMHLLIVLNLQESYSNSNEAGVNTDIIDEAWRQRVIYALQGQTVTNPINNNNDPRNQYLEPWGDGIDASLFNRADDDTKVFIMTPLDGSVTTASKKPAKPPAGPAMYQTKMNAIFQAISDHIGGTVELGDQYNYWRLDYNRATDRAQINTSERGVCLFQYDPNAFGTGVKGWRLFYEDRWYVSTEGAIS